MGQKKILATAVLTGAWLAGIASAQDKAQTADQVFKNIQVLKGISLDDFM